MDYKRSLCVDGFLPENIDQKTLCYKEINGTKWYSTYYFAKAMNAKGSHDINRAMVSSHNKIEIYFKNKKLWLINAEGIREFLINKRHRREEDICIYTHFKVDTPFINYTCKENKIGDQLKRVFRDINIFQQYPVKDGCTRYRIHFYLPDYKIAIEVDENGHKDRCKVDEMIRQDSIQRMLKCQFIRCNPDDDQFNIFDLIYQIRMKLNATNL